MISALTAEGLVGPRPDVEGAARGVELRVQTDGDAAPSTRPVGLGHVILADWGGRRVAPHAAAWVAQRRREVVVGAAVRAGQHVARRWSEPGEHLLSLSKWR